jgi:hypothetical protein
MIMTGTDLSDLTADEISRIVELIVDAAADAGAVTAPSVTLGEGQIRRFSIIA